MCAKKKRSLPKQWKIAGGSLPTSRLSPSENAIFEEAFDTYRGLVTKGHGTSSPRFLVPAEELKTRRSAALSMTEFLCDRYRDTFDRETVLRVLSIAAALPGSTADWYADSPGFLLGAALWLLDYLEDNCWEEDHFDLLPECHADELESRLPSVNDLNHSRSDILGLVTVLLGRKKEQRRSYRLLLDMVDVETVSELKTAFRNALLDHFERAAAVYRPVPSDEQPPLPFTQGNIAAMRQEPPLQRQPELDFLLMAPNLIGRSYEDAKQSLGTAKAGKLMCEITTKDPYALCAAYLLLERDGDVLAHLHMLTAGVLACAYRHLPWGCGDLVMEVLPYEEGTPDHTLRYPYHGSLYDWDADDAGEDGENTRASDGELMLSEVQLFYSATGILLPRHRVPSGDLTAWLHRQGVPEERARELAYGVMTAVCVEDQHEGLFWREAASSQLKGNEAPEPLVEVASGEEDTESADTLRARLKEADRQLKQSRRALHDADRAASELRDRLQASERERERDRAELAQLREALYLMEQRSPDEEEIPDAQIELPWRSRRRVVVFGGHDSWLKAIRPLLPNVRFFGHELPDLGAIRSADAVWLQANSMSHKHYYRIIEEVRKGDIPIRYFRYASARKCAEQLASTEDDVWDSPGDQA